MKFRGFFQKNITIACMHLQFINILLKIINKPLLSIIIYNIDAFCVHRILKINFTI